MMPFPSLQHHSPYFLLHKTEPDYKGLLVFGSAYWPLTRPFNQHNFDYRAIQCVYLGSSPAHHGSLCYRIPTKRTYVSKDIRFNECFFPFAHPSKPTSLPEPTCVPLPLPLIHTGPTQNQSILGPPPFSSSSLSSTPSQISPQHVQQPVRSITTRSQTGSACPWQFTDDAVTWPPPRAHLSTTLCIPETLSCYSTAQKHHEWRKAMSTKFNALLKNNTWMLVSPTEAPNVISCKWLFRTKHKVDGTIERRKARLVAKGFLQKSSLDYDQTFSPVIKATTLRLVLALAITHSWPIHQYDVQNAFIHGPLSETMFMAQPPGFSHPQFPNHVCKLRKAIYGLK